jgi:hypothetical protein
LASFTDAAVLPLAVGPIIKYIFLSNIDLSVGFDCEF